jgi:hypothetical protein
MELLEKTPSVAAATTLAGMVETRRASHGRDADFRGSRRGPLLTWVTVPQPDRGSHAFRLAR